MSPRYLRGASFTGYGATLSVGFGLPIPILYEQCMAQAAIPDDEITYPIIDYSEAYPLALPGDLGRVSMAELMTGQIEVSGKKVPTGALASRARAREVANELKQPIKDARFYLTQPVAPLPEAQLA